MKPHQVTLRDLFWLAMTIGLSLGWWLEYRKRKENERVATNAAVLSTYLNARGWKVEFRNESLSFQEPPGVTWGQDGLKYADAWDNWSTNFAKMSENERIFMRAAFLAGCEAALRETP